MSKLNPALVKEMEAHTHFEELREQDADRTKEMKFYLSCKHPMLCDWELEYIVGRYKIRALYLWNALTNI